ncbi:MAG: hypothetical protein LH606_08575 [Cytophagaceae bacterium]|nr:hypothetical protein [Cytophagaceae bacterium]
MNHRTVQRLFSCLLPALVAGLSAFLPVQAQNDYAPHYRRQAYKGVVRLVGGGGLGYYGGEMRSHLLTTMSLRPNINIGISYRLTQHVSLRGELGAYRLAGSDVAGLNEHRNLSFRTDNPEFYLVGVYNLFPYTQLSAYNFYVLGGLGFTRVNPKGRMNNRYYSLPRMRTEGVAYPRYAAMIPIGFGVSRRIKYGFDLALEARFTYTTTDYLDDVSTVYPQADLNNLAAAFSDRSVEAGFPPNPSGSKRGNSSSNDGYLFLQIRFEHTLGSSRRAIRRAQLRCANP